MGMAFTRYKGKRIPPASAERTTRLLGSQKGYWKRLEEIGFGFGLGFPAFRCHNHYDKKEKHLHTQWPFHSLLP